jgi:anaerobic dimethyl sulfoxide reductase subunit C (anchor subunit)
MWNEWPLVLFTLAIQAGAGLLLTGEIVDVFFSRRFGFPIFHHFRRRIRATVCSLTLSGLLLSFFHLGSPWAAVHSLGNLRTSWLSREILTALIFTAFVLFIFLFVLVSGAYRRIQRLAALAGAISGLVLIASMSNIYMLPAVPIWDHFSTIVSFFSASLLSGILITSVLLMFGSRSLEDITSEPKGPAEWIKKAVGSLAGGALFLLLLETGLTWLFVLRAESAPGWSLIWPGPAIGGILLPLRCLTALGGILLLSALIFKLRRRDSVGSVSPWLLTAAALIILLSEIFARFYFYALGTAGGM